MPRQKIKSKAQSELRRKIEDAFPTAHVVEEVYIGDLIDEQGYSMKEIEKELGNKSHRMFVDIVCRDSERTFAFEYHGEQHYHKNSKTMKTDATLLMNQQLDREKSWVLQRIGIPLVVVPFDIYVDQDVLDQMADDALKELEIAWSELTECPECERFFPDTQLPTGICHRCYDEKQGRFEKEQQRALEERRKEQRKHRSDFRKHLRGNIDKDPEVATERKQQAEERKQLAREYRRQKYQEWKQSEEYAKQKEEMKRKRKEMYREMKERKKKEKLS